jgi:hypothetical protein
MSYFSRFESKAVKASTTVKVRTTIKEREGEKNDGR